MFIDVHAHLGDEKLYGEINSVREEYLSKGVELVINSGYNLPSSKLSKEIAERFKECYFSAGYHPENCEEYDENGERELIELLSDKKCVAVGEIGLDYHYRNDNADKQKEVFERQILLAEKYSKPIIVHSRDSAKDTFDIIKSNIDHIKNGFLLHCYAESKELATEYVKLGGYFSFGGVITFKNAKKEDIIRSLPIERILTETDCPYMSPEPIRGSVNSPKNIPIICTKLAEIIEKPVDETANIVYSNAKRLFKI